MSQHSDWKALTGTVAYLMGGVGLGLYCSFRIAMDAAEYQSLYSHLPQKDCPGMLTFKSFSRIRYFVAGTFIYMGGLAALSYAMGLHLTIRNRLLQQFSLQMDKDTSKETSDTSKDTSDTELRQLGGLLSTMRYWSLSEEMIREAEEIMKKKKLADRIMQGNDRMIE